MVAYNLNENLARSVERFRDKIAIEAKVPDRSTSLTYTELGEKVRAAAYYISSLGNTPIVTEEIIYIGNDMLNDIWTAARRGIKTCLFAGDVLQVALRKDESLCQNLKPDVVVQNLSQIADMIVGL